MLSLIKRFPWFEVALIFGLAVALIVRPQNQAVSSPTSEQGSVIAPLTASTQPQPAL